MHVKKFEANSLDEAFKKIKRELGPDAIILKTVTNKGVKGIFKKSKIEITAAISEKNYAKKAKVDSVLDNDEKDKFYSGTSNVISHMIDNHSEHETEQRPGLVNKTGYGHVAINRSVKTVKNIEGKVKSGLDIFLNNASKEKEEKKERKEKVSHSEQVQIKKISRTEDQYKELYELQRQKMENLEKKLYQLKKEVLDMDAKGPEGVYQLRSILRSFGISEKYVSDVCKKALFELKKEELENADTVLNSP